MNTRDSKRPVKKKKRLFVRGPCGLKMLDSTGIYAKRPSPPFLVDGVIRRGSVVILGGYGSSGKSWLALDMFAAIDAGRPWLNRFQTKAGRVAYLDFEGGEQETCRRIRALTTSVKAPKIGRSHLAPMPNVFFGDDNFPETLNGLAAQHDLIIVDSFLAASPSVEENASSARHLIDLCRRVADRTNCAFLMIHHSRKTGVAGRSRPDPRELLRGSSAIFDAADGVFVVTVGKDETLRVEAAKARHGKKIEPFAVRIEDRWRAGANRRLVKGTTVEAVEIQDADAKSASTKLASVRTKILKTLGETGGLSGKLLASLVGVRRTVVDACVEQLSDAHEIENQGTHSRPRWHLTEASQGKTRRSNGRAP